MKIGVIGVGNVGRANVKGFLSLGHTVLEHDIKYNTKIQNVLDTEIVFICTHEKDVSSVVKELNLFEYNGVVAVRSTILPGTTDKLIKQNNLDICFVPEFLRQDYADTDFMDCALLAIGTYNLASARTVVKAFGNLPKSIEYMLPTEAEILKYYNNCYASMRIVFANMMYDIAKTYNADYDIIKNAYVKTGKSSGQYLNVNENLRGYSGACLPKDTKALIELVEQLHLDYDLIKSVHNDNSKLPKN
jgi:UDPglucose 6-dehydrogenase